MNIQQLEYILAVDTYRHFAKETFRPQYPAGLPYPCRP